MYMQHISAGKNARDAGFHAFIDIRPACNRIDFHARGSRQLVLRNQSDRQKQGIAGIALLGPRNRFPVRSDLRDGNRRDVLFSLNVYNGMGEL